MILQKILFPTVGICTTEELYYRKSVQTKHEYIDINNIEQSIVFNKEKINISFDTYFNSFSIEKWDKYTILDNVNIRLKLKGKFKIILKSKQKINNNIFESIFSETVFESKDIKKNEIEFMSFEKKGIYTFEIESLEKGSSFYGGEYFTKIDESKLNNVNLALDICTFKREKFIERNIELLNNNILFNDKSILKDNLSVYISDNGKSLDKERLSNKNINIYSNKNLGGAGGFTRGLIEILNYNDNTSNMITHAIIMDDDVIIDTNSLERMYILLKFVKKEYKDSFIGGAMLRLDYQHIQHESGARYKKGYFNPLKHNIDLTNLDGILQNQIEETVDYLGWWYCCIPMTIISKDNLPLPIFIKVDDMEYSLRNMKHTILLNGICVWHEPFENKYTSFIEYYHMRNGMINNALHVENYKKIDFIKYLFKRITREMSYYRYNNVNLIYKAVDDFYKGIDFLKIEDGEFLHRYIMDMGYKSIPIEDLDIPFSYGEYEHSLYRQESKFKRLIRFATLNGYLLPSKKDKIAPMALARPINFYRAKRVLNYDVTTKKGFITQIDRRLVIINYFKFIKLSIKTIFKYNKTVKEYKNRVKEITNLEFWNKYLDLDKLESKNI